LRATVDNNIVNPSINGLMAGKINYENILPKNNPSPTTYVNGGFNQTSDIANNILNSIAPIDYSNRNPQAPFVQKIESVANNHDPNQMELPLFKQPEIKDIHKKLFDIEKKLDKIITYVKDFKN
jgi:hypothetical protein